MTSAPPLPARLRIPLGARPILWGYVGSAALAVAVYWLATGLALPPLAVELLVVLLALGKSVVVVWANLTRVHQVTVEHLPFHRYLAFLVLSLSLLIFSFGLDTYLLQRLVPGSYAGFNPRFTELELLFESYYFSFLNLTIYGVVEIIPKSIAAKTLLIFEEALVFLTLVYVLSDFVSLRDSIRSSYRDEGQA